MKKLPRPPKPQPKMKSVEIIQKKSGGMNKQRGNLRFAIRNAAIAALRNAHHIQLIYDSHNIFCDLRCVLVDSNNMVTAEYTAKAPCKVMFVNDKLEEPCTVSYIMQDTNKDLVWQTFCGNLSPLDEICFHIIPDAFSSIPMLEHGFHGDSLRVAIYRGERRQFHYILYDLVSDSPDNRIIQGLTKNPSDAIARMVLNEDSESD